MLEFRVFNILKGNLPLRGRLPITPGSHLTWFGFSEEGQLCSFDSKVFMNILISYILDPDILIDIRTELCRVCLEYLQDNLEEVGCHSLGSLLFSCCPFLL